MFTQGDSENGWLIPMILSTNVKVKRELVFALTQEHFY